MSLDTEENTVTSAPNTAISAATSVHTGSALLYNATAGDIGENQSYVEIPGNYSLNSLPFDASGSLAYSSAITTFDDDKTDSVTMCDDDNMMSNNNLTDDNIGGDDDCTNHSSTPNRRVRFKYTKIQLRRFEDHFRMNMFPDSIIREEISKELNIPVRNVQVWFKNRRAKHRKSAQMDNTPNSSYLEHSTILPTPDRNNSFQSSGGAGGYSFNNSMSQHYIPQNNPHNSSYMMVNNHHPFHGSINSSSNTGGYPLNSNQFPGMIGMSPVNSHNTSNAHVAQAAAAANSNSSTTTATTNNNMLHYNNPYRGVVGNNHMMPPPNASFYKSSDHNKYGPSDANLNSSLNASIYGSSHMGAMGGATRATPLTNNPFLLNVPSNAVVYPQLPQHYHPQSMAQFNSSLQSQRPLYYHNVTHPNSAATTTATTHSSSTLPSHNNIHSAACHNNENISLCHNSVIKTEHKTNDCTDTNQLNAAATDKKLSKRPAADYLHENYLNR